MVKERITVSPGLVNECAALDFMSGTRNEIAWRIISKVSQILSQNTAAICHSKRYTVPNKTIQEGLTETAHARKTLRA